MSDTEHGAGCEGIIRRPERLDQGVGVGVTTPDCVLINGESHNTEPTRTKGGRTPIQPTPCRLASHPRLQTTPAIHCDLGNTPQPPVHDRLASAPSEIALGRSKPRTPDSTARCWLRTPPRDSLFRLPEASGSALYHHVTSPSHSSQPIVGLFAFILFGFNERRGYQGARSGTLAFLTFWAFINVCIACFLWFSIVFDTVWDGKPWFVFVFLGLG
jgi:hypothetical protein